MKHRPELRFLAVVVVVCAVLMAVGRTRAETPRPMTGAPTPAEVVGRLNAALEARQPQDYRDCLAEDFSFSPYSAVVAAYPQVKWREWGVAQEFEFARWLSSPARKVAMHLAYEVKDRGIESDGQVEWDVVYLLRIDGSTFSGRAILTFVELRKLWYLQSWEDTRPEPYEGTVVPTSGEARASFTR
ncbi:MAG TPA: hypothetical protein PLQ13_04675 [Candidatus Krumholzibacteria bacterium]|nr:hypothetical protein [Candidatus Krumholzibacteria bacterium]